MTIALFKDTSYTLQGVMEAVRRGEIALPDIQRPFVWPSSKVRDLFDSMYKGFPVGYLLFWSTGAEVGARRIGTEAKEAVPRLLVVDGQQRLTSLFSVLTGATIVRKDHTEGRIRIAFRPEDQRFEVADAAIVKDPEFIPDITEIWKSYRETLRRYLAGLKEHRETPPTVADEDRLEGAIDRLRDLQHYPFRAVELTEDLDEERVATIFVRINSEGVKLNQADFILTLMSVWWEDGRKQLEAFSRAAKQPSTTAGASPFNYFLEPAPDQMLRVAVGYAFRRGRLQHVYSLLRGKDLDTGVVSTERRLEQFEKLKAAQNVVLDLANWHEMLKCVSQAGFTSGRMISSENALLYTYVLWLIGRHEHGVPVRRLSEVIARWFFMAQTTGRYTSSPESQLESDLLRLRDLAPADPEGFCAWLDREVFTVFTADYWAISLPNRLQTSGARSPALYAYWAALNLLEAELLFTSARVSTLLGPGVKRVRDIERHHLFPKKYLATQGVTGPSRVNQIANMAFVDWPENAGIGAKSPGDYWPTFSAKVDPERLKRQRYWHALPVGWEQLAYDDFLAKRRKLIAEVVRDGFATLAASTPSGKKTVTTTVGALIEAGESLTVEFKSSARWNYKASMKDPRMEHVVVKTVAGLMNAEGGTLLIGVDDAGQVLGLEPDYKTLGKQNRDGYELFLTTLLQNGMDGATAALTRISFHGIDGQDVCRVDVAASARPVFARAADAKEHTEFFARIGNSTRPLVGSEMVEYQQAHWG